MVQFKNVSKIFTNGVVGVEDINFTIDEGEFVFLIGPSGSGKTTLIEMLIRDQKPSSGQIFLSNTDITNISRSKVYTLRRKIGVIFQDFKLVEDKTSYENVAFAMEAAGKTNREIKETVPYLLDIVGLSHRMKSFPKQLSGGEQQRVAIARAIANNPRILIADEPTGNLDPASAWDIVQILTKINNWGTTVIMSTHGTDIVNSLNKRVIQMQGGRIIRDDSEGQYEFYQSDPFEEPLDADKFENSKTPNEESSQSEKKTSIKINITDKIKEESDKDYSDEIEDSSENLLGSEKSSVFGRIIGIFRRQNENNSSNINPQLLTLERKFEEEDSENQNSDVDDNFENNDDSEKEELQAEKEEDKDFEEEVLNKIDGEDEKKAKSKVSKKKKEEKSSLKGLSSGFENIKLEKKSEKDSNNLAFSTKNIEKINGHLVEELNLPKQTINNIHDAGYKKLEELVKAGPQTLAAKKSISDEEVVMIAKAIEKYLSNL